MNASGRWQSSREMGLLEIGNELLRALQTVLRRESLDAAHVKLLVCGGETQLKGGFTHQQGPVQWESGNGPAKAKEGELVLNARVKADPNALTKVVTEAFSEAQTSIGLTVSFHQWECFSPNPPRPTHRLNRLGVSVPLECENPLLATR